MKLPITGVPLPVRLTFDKPLTDDELLCFSEGNEVVWIEREADGTLYAKPIADSLTGSRMAHINCDVCQWAEKDGRGDCYGRAGWLLPDGSMRGAPISWGLHERLETRTDAERKGYARLAPDFIVEVMSAFDDPVYMRHKMDQWIANGVQVAWLIEGDERRVTIYRAGEGPEVHQDPISVQGIGPVRGFELVMGRIWSD